MALVAALLAVFGFAAALWKSGVFSLFRDLSAETVGGVSAMFDASLDDDAKEAAVRRAGFRLLGGAGRIILWFALALIAALVPIYLFDLLGLAGRGASFGVLLRLDFILAVSALAIGLAWLLSRRARARGGEGAEAGAGAAGGQGLGDQMLHALAFASPAMLKGAARLDDRLYSSGNAGSQPPPVFITSLARGGTTALLNALHGRADLATHLYRDMPFVTAPMLWSKLGGKGRRVERRKRAHGDGIEIDLDSPEAFDEVLWMLRWPEKYSKAGIGLWSAADADPRATAFFERHFEKITRLRRGAEARARYLSKNNANIARLGLLPEMFPGAGLVVPLRRPGPHAASLMRQHVNFTARHGEDRFTERYMGDIGHFEFGALHRPILFDSMPAPGPGPDDGDYWLAYWVAAFREVARHGDRIHLVDQDDLRAHPDQIVNTLLERLGLEPGGAFRPFFHDKPDREPEGLFSSDLLAEATELYENLRARALR